MVRPILLFAALLAGAAFAQTSTTTVNTNPLIIRTQTSDLVDTQVFGPELCGTSYSVRWKYQASLGQLCGDITFWATDASSCGAEQGPDDLALGTATLLSLSAIPSANIPVKIAELPGFVNRTLSDGGVAAAVECGAADKYKVHRVCASALSGGLTGCLYQTNQTKLKASEFKLIYDTQPPTAPVVTNAAATNGEATISFELNSDATNAQTVTVALGGDGGVDGAPITGEALTASTGAIRVTGLSNNADYSIQVRFIDGAGNVGPLSDAVVVTPIKTIGFWGDYRARGGTDEGGCSVGWGLMPALAALWFMKRRMSR